MAKKLKKNYTEKEKIMLQREDTWSLITAHQYLCASGLQATNLSK